MPISADQLASLPILKGLTSVDVEELAAHLDPVDMGEGEVVIREGDDPDHPMYFMLSGNVEVLMHGHDGRDHVIASLAAPSVFGELEVLAQRPAIASVVTTTAVRFAQLRRGVFQELVAEDRLCALKLTKNIAQTLAFRLAATDTRLAAYFSNVASGANLHTEVRNLIITGQG